MSTDFQIAFVIFELGFGTLGVGIIVWSTIPSIMKARKYNTIFSFDKVSKNDLKQYAKKTDMDLWKLRIGLAILGICFALHFISKFV